MTDSDGGWSDGGLESLDGASPNDPVRGQSDDRGLEPAQTPNRPNRVADRRGEREVIRVPVVKDRSQAAFFIAATLAAIAAMISVAWFVMRMTAGGSDPTATGTAALVMVILASIPLTVGIAYRRDPSPDLSAWPGAGELVRSGLSYPDLLALGQGVRQLDRGSAPAISELWSERAPITDALEILQSPVWSDPWLRDRRLEIDPAREAYEIIDYLQRVDVVYADLAAKHEQFGVTSGYDRMMQHLVSEVPAVQRRADALHEYARQLKHLEQVLAVEDALPQIDADQQRVLDLLSESVRHELAADYLAERSGQLELIATTLQGLKDQLTTESLPQLEPAPHVP